MSLAGTRWAPSLSSQYLLMHSVYYRTEMLRKMRLTLPEHTFYVDNIFVYEPLVYVRTMRYSTWTPTITSSAARISRSTRRS